MLMLTGYFILMGELFLHLVDKAKNFVVPRHILHGQSASIRLATISHSFNLNKVRLAQADQTGILFYLLGVPSLDQRQSVHCSLAFFVQHSQTVQIALPVVFEQRTLRIVHLPLPLGAYRICVVTPTEHAFVGTRQ
ncbi:hypothetical protein BpHYR1_031541 [Brachionus plicatilis]|uniref:Secreted protein n=1 Tax=Brachionus plicatilis TaxID=10195 RepID=A0A3M7PX47_BRAPC|nr:hypothetical protein BpHYR1_031541 [Brachionus plicatilis]